MSKVKAILLSILVAATIGSPVVYAVIKNEEQWSHICDGKDVTVHCTGDDGVRYAEYVFHEAIEEQREIIHHPAVPAITHTIHHNAVYGVQQVITGCVKTNIKYKNGTCALSRCRDGMYSGSTGWGTCNYHGGVWYGGGPWYTYREESYIVTPAWDETIVDVPAKEAWDEEIIVAPAVEAYYEKVISK